MYHTDEDLSDEDTAGIVVGAVVTAVLIIGSIILTFIYMRR